MKMSWMQSTTSLTKVSNREGEVMAMIMLVLEETAMKARGGHPGGLPECMRKKYIGMLQDNVSIIAMDTSKNNYICGIMLSSLAIK